MSTCVAPNTTTTTNDTTNLLHGRCLPVSFLCSSCPFHFSLCFCRVSSISLLLLLLVYRLSFHLSPCSRVSSISLLLLLVVYRVSLSSFSFVVLVCPFIFLPLCRLSALYGFGDEELVPAPDEQQVKWQKAITFGGGGGGGNWLLFRLWW